ncbi:MAG: hypothetical protein ACRDL6_06740, partial [Solirubrobacterales bacterium]
MAPKPGTPGREAEDVPVGDLSIVLHSHMPYVEGFGTYPFGEEWLFDAVARSHLPVLEVAERLTMTVTPVLADQLEADGVGERMLAFLRRHRLEAAERDATEAEEPLRDAALAEADHYRRAIEQLEGFEGGALGAFQRAEQDGRVALMTSAATHAVMPKLATLAGRRLQVDAGLRSHRRRFAGYRGAGGAEGFWLPECAYVAGLEGVLGERGIAYTCLDQSADEHGTEALTPVRLPGGPVGFTIDWPAVELVWSDRGYPADPAYLEYHRLSPHGIRLWSIGGDPYDAEAARRRAAGHAAAFLTAVRDRL